MNLLEHYIEEVHNEEYLEDVVKVELTILCYGNREKITTAFTKEYWEVVKEKGYYMA